MRDNKKKNTNLAHAGIGVFAVVLAALIIVMMIIVSGIQGTARVVNYAGLVRGKTQRIVKLEISGQKQDEMLESVESFINGLRYGDDELNLVALKDKEFQSKMEELDNYFDVLKKEIYRVRKLGYEETDIIPKSEKFFVICDEATGLAEAYSQRKASDLKILEKYIIADIIALMALISYELIKAIRYAALNRSLQKKVYLDEATGLPNKNKCEELLNAPEIIDSSVGVCSFDLNNLRRINNSMGHEAGDVYIRRFAICLRKSLPEEFFVGRAGGDEFIAVCRDISRKEMKKSLENVRREMREESKEHPDIPLSYAVGFALAEDNSKVTMRDMFNLADKNMYINKNHVKREEAAEEKKLDLSLLKFLDSRGKLFSSCLYCDVKLDTYRTIRAGDDFFLATDGSYTGAVEQIAEEEVSTEEREGVRASLNPKVLKEELTGKDKVKALQYSSEGRDGYNRLTMIPVDWDEDGALHHFLLAFENIITECDDKPDAKEQLTLYYQQLKQSIIENDSYVDALLEMADSIYTVNLTKDILEWNIDQKTQGKEKKALFVDCVLPCSYSEYCSEYMKSVTKETLGNYRLTDSSSKLLKQFDLGEKHLSTEYCRQEPDGSLRWIQKTVLMTETTVFDSETLSETPIVNAIILMQDTSQMHERDEQENAKLQVAFDEMRTANRTKTEFLRRMSHDIRTPLNGIIGLLQIDEEHFDDRDLVLENHRKMKVSADHLLSLINDVLQMSKLEDGNFVLSHEYVDLRRLSEDVLTIIEERAKDTNVNLIYDKRVNSMPYMHVMGSPLHLRQIFLNIYGNCIKYNRQDGSITTTVALVDENEKTCRYRWTISDTGIGMSKEFLERIFEPFVQERSDARSVYQGTGLGMSIVKGLLDKMGGSIEITSEEGVGSTFVIEIPFEITAPEEESADKDKSFSGSIKGLNLLLAEDNVLNAEILEILLKDEGVTLTVAYDGEEAVKLFKENEPGFFDAILMDIMMPVMDGITATKTIRAMDRPDAVDIPIIALTANAFDEDAKECKQAGMNAHLSKPVQMNKLIETISTLISDNTDAKEKNNG